MASQTPGPPGPPLPAVASAAEPSAPAGSGAEKEEAVEAGRQGGRGRAELRFSVPREARMLTQAVSPNPISQRNSEGRKGLTCVPAYLLWNLQAHLSAPGSTEAMGTEGTAPPECIPGVLNPLSLRLLSSLPSGTSTSASMLTACFCLLGRRSWHFVEDKM